MTAEARENRGGVEGHAASPGRSGNDSLSKRRPAGSEGLPTLRPFKSALIAGVKPGPLFCLASE